MERKSKRETPKHAGKLKDLKTKQNPVGGMRRAK